VLTQRVAWWGVLEIPCLPKTRSLPACLPACFFGCHGCKTKNI